MNTKLRDKIKQRGKSAYYISQKTGIPYTTISELVTDKIDINSCSAGTVYKLALFFKCSIEDILNEELSITNMKGSHKGIKYQWKQGNSKNVDLHIWDNNDEHVIDSGDYSQPRFFIAYNDMTELLIDLYVDRKNAEAMLND